MYILHNIIVYIIFMKYFIYVHTYVFKYKDMNSSRYITTYLFSVLDCSISLITILIKTKGYCIRNALDFVPLCLIVDDVVFLRSDKEHGNDKNRTFVQGVSEGETRRVHKYERTGTINKGLSTDRGTWIVRKCP